MLSPFGRTASFSREMNRLRREMDRLFADWPSEGLQTATGYPAMNVWVNEGGAIITAEVPGCTADNFDLSVVNNTLVLKGTRPVEELPEDATYHRRERGCGSFTRSFTLPFEIDVKGVDAMFKNGVLHITLPRTEEDKPKKITVKVQN